YAKNPDLLMPFDAAIWILEAHFDSFFSEAREELNAAKSNGDPEAIEKANKKYSAVGYASLNMGAMSDLRAYLEGMTNHA
ncbi:hypothetical protein ACA085_20345, partial [Xanthomonas fragariae]